MAATRSAIRSTCSAVRVTVTWSGPVKRLHTGGAPAAAAAAAGGAGRSLSREPSAAATWSRPSSFVTAPMWTTWCRRCCPRGGARCCSRHAIRTSRSSPSTGAHRRQRPALNVEETIAGLWSTSRLRGRMWRCDERTPGVACASRWLRKSGAIDQPIMLTTPRPGGEPAATCVSGRNRPLRVVGGRCTAGATSVPLIPTRMLKPSVSLPPTLLRFSRLRLRRTHHTGTKHPDAVAGILLCW